MPGRKIVIAGGTGFIGARLVAALITTGEEVVVLTRNDSSDAKLAGARSVSWDARHLGDWATELEGAYAVINLAGENIAQRWDEAAKARILQSRVDGVDAIRSGVQRAKSPPKRWLNASAVGFYGDRRDVDLDESSAAGSGFLAETCVAWEDAVRQTELPATAVSVFRIGFVLGNEGALPVLAKLARLGLGGAAGDGKQPISWIHLADVVGIVEWLMDGAHPPAIVNATAPLPTTNGEFMHTLRDVVHAPFGLPAPAFAIRAAGWLFGPNSELILTGARVLPREALRGGYEFKFTDLRETLTYILGR